MWKMTHHFTKRGIGTQNYSNSPCTLYWNVSTKPHNWTIMYVCVRGLCLCFYDFNIGSWYFFDSLVFVWFSFYPNNLIYVVCFMYWRSHGLSKIIYTIRETSIVCFTVYSPCDKAGVIIQLNALLSQRVNLPSINYNKILSKS